MIRKFFREKRGGLAGVIKAFFAFQRHFTHIVEVNQPNVEPCLYAMWHGNQCCVFGLKNKGKTNVLISRSRDGDIVAAGVEMLGFKTIRGSKGKKGAVEATLQMIDILKKGENCAMMVDGPKGPAKKVKDGIIKIAKLAGVPIVPMCWYSSNPNWLRFNSWDSFTVPILDVRLINLYGEPIYVDPHGDDAADEEARIKLQKSLDDLDTRIANEYNKVYWHGLWRRKTK